MESQLYVKSTCSVQEKDWHNINWKTDHKEMKLNEKQSKPEK
jgi:hypothetical protein